MKTIPEGYKEDIKKFQSAYIRKYNKVQYMKSVRTLIARHLGAEDDWSLPKEIFRIQPGSYRSKWDETMYELIGRDGVKEYEKAGRSLMSCNRILNKTKYTFWHYYPKGTPKIEHVMRANNFKY